MYYYEKDYIMRLIHGIAQVLARLLLGRQMEEGAEIASVLNREAREALDRLRRMTAAGEVNRAEECLFDLLETAPWDRRQKAALALSFYDDLNGRDDDFLARADFSREEIIEGLEDALRAVDLEIPEYLKI